MKKHLDEKTKENFVEEEKQSISISQKKKLKKKRKKANILLIENYIIELKDDQENETPNIN